MLLIIKRKKGFVKTNRPVLSSQQLCAIFRCFFAKKIASQSIIAQKYLNLGTGVLKCLAQQKTPGWKHG